MLGLLGCNHGTPQQAHLVVLNNAVAVFVSSREQSMARKKIALQTLHEPPVQG